ncbi:MAG: tautomerase family protein [bacterium]
MALVKIEIVTGKSPEYKEILLNCIHSALVENLKVPENDRIQLVSELEPKNVRRKFMKSDNFTLIEILMFAGRSVAVKKNLYRDINDRIIASLGIKEQDIMIIIHDIPMENWGLYGRPASELDLDYDVEI